MKLVALLLAAVAACGCGASSEVSPLLDNIRIGSQIECGGCGQPQTGANCGACESVATLARRGFDDQWPEHSPIVSLSFHAEGYSPGPSGELILHNRSGSLTVAVATLADGRRHAVAVYCGVSGCLAMSWYRSDG